MIDQRRLGYTPVAFAAFEAGGSSGSARHMLVVSEHKMLMVYSDQQLLWSAQAPFIPVEVKISTFGG
eukprot:14122-Amorphochlora_amoeboformis.AAC.2